MLSSLSQNADSQSVAAFGEKLISILFQSFNEENNMANSPSISFLTDSERQELMDILSNTAMTEDTLEQLENGTLSLHDTLTIDVYKRQVVKPTADDIEDTSPNEPDGISQEQIQTLLDDNPENISVEEFDSFGDSDVDDNEPNPSIPTVDAFAGIEDW